MSKEQLMRVFYYMPGVAALIRIGFTVWFIGWQPIPMPLPYTQVLTIVIYLILQFTYFRLYRDSVPVISVLVPTILHSLLIFVFLRQVVIAPFVLLVLLDVMFLSSRGIKSSMYPFYIEEDDEEQLLEEILNYMDETG